MIRNCVKLSALFGLAASTQARAEDAYFRVVDVGNALCVVAKAPGNNYMLFDAGNHNTRQCQKAVREIVKDKKIDLVVLGHSDADHVGEFADIFRSRSGMDIGQLIYTGRPGTAKKAWPEVAATIKRIEMEGKRQGRRIVRNLRDEPLPNTLGRKPLTVKLGDAAVTFVAGWNNWRNGNEAGAALSQSEKNNVVSIVAKFTYAGRSVLLTGDTVGRVAGDKPDACRYAEKWMVEKSRVALKSDVLIGQHHGGDNSSSTCFIKAAAPDYVVFPAGHVKDYDHPRQSAAERFLRQGIPASRIFRTDRGDDQGAKEWNYGRTRNCKDKTGDDDIEIFIPSNPAKPVRVQYRTVNGVCALR
ncbi:MAG: hypothetical protein DI586_07100 [Micavibrio aeruginosavorus]|uniref:Metallo-beta-lactamase domain-containing protein n=1 Tax=Micavibrio aeruginosavorus TaxID=349221 RepID=A0A2W5FK27_9BACT|nr:MAG: hypothetical protein DI586_07100 [Micavibrio aeruginosavorus]